MTQTVKLTPFYIYARDCESGNEFIMYFDTHTELMHKASELVAFSDIYPLDLLEVYANTHRYEYVGWRPDMQITFVEAGTDRIVWDEYYPEWDH